MTSIGRIWQTEGTRALRDRVWDRLRDRRWQATSWVASGEPWPSTPLLNAIGVPLTTQYGGVPLQLRARLMHEVTQRPIALVSRDATGQPRLDTWDAGRHHGTTFPRGRWTGDPLLDDLGWLDAIRISCRLVRATAVHIENAASLSLASLARLADVDEGLSIALSVHDFSLFCRRPHLWEACGGFCGYSTDAARCAACLTAGGDGFTIDQATHRSLASKILAVAAPIIVPSAFMRDQLSTLFPSIDPANLQIVPPGIAIPAELAPSRRLPHRVAVISGPQDHKGGARLPALAQALAGRGLTLTVYGGYGHEHLRALRRVRGTRVRGYFRAGTLSELLAREGVTVAIALSPVPESFSLVVSEAWAAGVPVIAPAAGAFVERLTDGCGGLLVPVNPTDADLIDAIERLRGDSNVHLPVPPTVEAAADAHLALYRACRRLTSS